MKRGFLNNLFLLALMICSESLSQAQDSLMEISPNGARVRSEIRSGWTRSLTNDSSGFYYGKSYDRSTRKLTVMHGFRRGAEASGHIYTMQIDPQNSSFGNGFAHGGQIRLEERTDQFGGSTVRTMAVPLPKAQAESNASVSNYPFRGFR